MLRVRPVWVPFRIALKYDVKKAKLSFSSIFIDLVNEINTHFYEVSYVASLNC